MNDLATLIKAGYGCIQIVTAEEDRAVAAVTSIAKKDLAHKDKRPNGYSIWTWAVTKGLRDSKDQMVVINVVQPDGTKKATPDILGKSKDPVVALDYFMNGNIEKHSVVILKDFHLYLKQANPMLIRLLKEAIAYGRKTNRHLIIIGCQLHMQPELEKEIHSIDMPLPDRAELAKVAEGIAKSANKELNGNAEAVVESMVGMTTNEAGDAASFSISKVKKLDPDIIGKIKTDAIKRNGIVEIVEGKSDGIDSIGGLSSIKEWLKKRVSGFTKEAKAFGVQSPKGYLIIGISGCGKSEIAKVTASMLKVPMLRLDGGKLFGSYVGDSEKNMRTALRTAEAMSPCLLFVDELDKALAGSQSSGHSDGGTTSRVIGTFLQWMQDKTAPVFVVATANDVSKLPPETLRRGRFDQIFFVDLPDNDERSQIWHIHIKKANRKPSEFDLERLSKETDGYTGAEIASIVGDGIVNAYHDKKEPDTDTFSSAIKETVPLSITMKERIDNLRKWADGRAIRASGPVKTKK